MMNREEAHDLAKATAEMLGYPYSVVRSKEQPDLYNVFEDAAAITAKWFEEGWEIEATYQPPEVVA